MTNQKFYIPSGGIGEIYYDKEERVWYAIASSEFNENKITPFLKLLIELRGAPIKYLKNQTRNNRCTNYSLTAKKTIRYCSQLTQSYMEIKQYSEDLFSTAEIDTVPHSLEVYRQFIKEIPLEWPICESDCILESLSKIKKPLAELEKLLLQFYKSLKVILPKQYETIGLQKNKFYGLKEQFKGVMIIYGKISNFFWLHFFFFDLKKFFS